MKNEIWINEVWAGELWAWAAQIAIGLNKTSAADFKDRGTFVVCKFCQSPTTEEVGGWTRCYLLQWIRKSWFLGNSNSLSLSSIPPSINLKSKAQTDKVYKITSRDIREIQVVSGDLPTSFHLFYISEEQILIFEKKSAPDPELTSSLGTLELLVYRKSHSCPQAFSLWKWKNH